MPAAGYRRTLTGAVGGVGGEGLYWSSSSFGGSGNSYGAGYLYFHSDRLDPLNANNRSYGFAVRCVQHPNELFLPIRPLIFNRIMDLV